MKIQKVYKLDRALYSAECYKCIVPTNILEFFTAKSSPTIWAQLLSLTLCSPMDCHPPSSSAHGVFQAKILEWGVISYPRGSSRPRDWTHVSCISCTGRQVPHHWATREALTSPSELLRSTSDAIWPVLYTRPHHPHSCHQPRFPSSSFSQKTALGEPNSHMRSMRGIPWRPSHDPAPPTQRLVFILTGPFVSPPTVTPHLNHQGLCL